MIISIINTPSVCHCCHADFVLEAPAGKLSSGLHLESEVIFLIYDLTLISHSFRQVDEFPGGFKRQLEFFLKKNHSLPARIRGVVAPASSNQSTAGNIFCFSPLVLSDNGSASTSLVKRKH